MSMPLPLGFCELPEQLVLVLSISDVIEIWYPPNENSVAIRTEHFINSAYCVRCTNKNFVAIKIFLQISDEVNSWTFEQQSKAFTYNDDNNQAAVTFLPLIRFLLFLALSSAELWKIFGNWEKIRCSVPCCTVCLLHAIYGKWKCNQLLFKKKEAKKKIGI